MYRIALHLQATARVAAIASLCLVAAFPASAHKAHAHGQADVDVVAVADTRATLSVRLASPLENFFGFERAPRNAKERATVNAAMDVLRRGDTLFLTPPAAQCRMASAELDVGSLNAVLSTRASSSAAPATPATTTAAASTTGDHADLSADYIFHCDNPAALRSLDVRLSGPFPAVRKVTVRLSAPGGQKGVSLTPTSTRVNW